jgi:hypothetical protein
VSDASSRNQHQQSPTIDRDDATAGVYHAPKKDSCNRGGELRRRPKRSGAERDLERASQIPQSRPRSRCQISRLLSGARSERRPASPGDLAEIRVGSDRWELEGAMASAHASSSATAASSRKDHLEAGKKRVGSLLPVACGKCSRRPPAIAG